MGYIPKFIHLDHFYEVDYPFGIYWSHEYIQASTKAVYDTYKKDIEDGTSITFVVRGTSGAIIAGAMLNELHHINPDAKIYILVVRKDNDLGAHSPTLRGIDYIKKTKFIVVDDLVSSGETIEAILQALDEHFEITPYPSNKYDMLCISNIVYPSNMKKNCYSGYKIWKSICSRFEYVTCCPKPI